MVFNLIGKAFRCAPNTGEYLFIRNQLNVAIHPYNFSNEVATGIAKWGRLMGCQVL